MSGLGTWDVTWGQCPTCPAPVMPDQEHQCLDLHAVKYVGTETRTDEHWARLRESAEAAAPRLERERAAMVEVFDRLIEEGQR